MIRWPEKYHPDRTGVHVRNEIEIPVPPEVVWQWLIHAEHWPAWYSNSDKVAVEGGGPLRPGSKFRWKTFGVNLESKVEEFVPGERIAWSARAPGIDAYHAWYIEPRPTGSYVLTEETQNGWLARLGKLFMPNRMKKYHQLWLEALMAKARQGLPPMAH